MRRRNPIDAVSRAAVTLRLLASLGLVLAASFASLACSSETGSSEGAFAPSRPVKRLGEPVGFADFANTTKPIVGAAGASSVTLGVSEADGDRLLLSLAKSSIAAGQCAATWQRDGESPVEIATVAVAAQAREVWVEFEGTLPSETRGELRLACDAALGSVTWAQPLVVQASRANVRTSEGSEVGENAPLIVLVSLDTLRADALEGFAADGATAPNLAGLAQEGLVMPNAAAEAAWTLPSHYALFRSRLRGMAKFEGGKALEIPLPEALAAAGFATAAMTGGGWIAPSQGFHRGFDHFFVHWNPNASDLPPIRGEALRWLDRFRGAPTFVFVHTYAAHLLSPAVEAYRKSRDGQGFPKRVDDDYERDFYAALVRTLDTQLNPLFERLRSEARLRPVLLIVTSDHGQALGEHGFHGHGKSAFGLRGLRLFDEVVRVPLIVWAPGIVAPGRVVERPTNLSDIAPSILSAAGVARPPSMTGANLWPHWRSVEVPAPESPGSLTHIEGEWALRDSTHKLIVRTGQKPGVSPIFELYAVAGEFSESGELSEGAPEVVSDMRKRLRERLAQFGVGSSAGTVGFDECASEEGDCGVSIEELDAETQRQLRALGYAE